MIFLRLLLIAVLISAIVLFALYLISDKAHYLIYLKRLFKFTLWTLVGLAVLFLLRRLW
ncbi:MAG: hypothetical protein ORN21_02695 [Methylophilaceae bacterium]|nr:hypothetical protein [Methylophilaceae bacterium]